MTACPERKEALVDHALGQPADPALQAHLAVCAGCSGALRDLQDKAGQVTAGIQRLATAEPRPYGPERILAAIDPPPTRPIYVRFALAGLPLVLCVALALYWTNRPEPRLPPAALALSEWRSPTQSLLRSPADPLLKGVPRLGEAFLDMKSTGDKNVP